MAIFAGSRYANAKISAVQQPDGTVRPYIHSRKVFGEDDIGANSEAISFQSGAELDLYAFRSWGVEEKWWFIADVNNIMFPLFDETTVGPNQIHIGTSIQIPAKSDMTILTS